MSEKITEIESQTLEIKSKPSPNHSKMDEKYFENKVRKLLLQSKLWRSSEALATSLGVDSVDFNNWTMDKEWICSKSSKKEGVFLYALTSRLHKPETRQLVTEEDRYVLAGIQNTLTLIDTILKKHAVRIHTCSSETFDKLVQGKNAIEAGLFLFATVTKTDLKKLI